MSTKYNSANLGISPDGDILNIIGYGSDLSVAPGEEITFYVSTNRDTYTADIIELTGGMTDAESGLFPFREVETDCGGEYEGLLQTTDIGSFAVLPLTSPFTLTGDLTATVRFRPTSPTQGHDQVVWEVTDTEGRDLALVVDQAGHLQLQSGGQVLMRTEAAVKASEWYFAGVACDSRGSRMYVRQSSGWFPGGHSAQESIGAPVADVHGTADADHTAGVTLAGRLVASDDTTDRAVDHFNGKIEAPALYQKTMQSAQLRELADSDTLPHLDSAVGVWDLGEPYSGTALRELTGKNPEGRVHQGPLRAVTGHNWDGRYENVEAAPSQYAAIHFHEDDLEDSAWQPSIHWTVPETLPSGAYALRLRIDGETDYVPFFVRAVRSSGDRALFLFPTNTYLAYANERLFESGLQEEFMQHRIQLAPQDEFILEHPEIGKSAYDTHSDGSGVALTSWRRPILNMRPHYHNWLSGSLRHLTSDLFLLEWLRSTGSAVDVATDEDLHREGNDVLARYQVIVTGSHPEYWTRPMMDALEGYLGRGGRLMYLGGNGFYWVTSAFSDRPMLEIRRGNSGTRCWDSPPGEVSHSSTGEPGGLWRFNGYVPQRLVGVGMAAQGWGPASSYHRLPDSFDPRARFIFEGIGADEKIGDFGYVLGGAAGDEVDRFGTDLGTPAHALRLATASGLDTRYQLTQEELLMTAPGQGGGETELVRSDLTFFETPEGGAVFSVGSICWAGSLAWNNFDNNVARLSSNVLTRFLDPAPL